MPQSKEQKAAYMKEYMKEYREENNEQIAAYKKEYYEENPELNPDPKDNMFRENRYKIMETWSSTRDSHK